MELTGNVFYLDWEVGLMEFLQSIMGNWAIALAKFFTLFGEELIMVGVVGVLYWCIDKKLGRKAILNLMCVLAWAPMIKNVVFRRRPYFDNPGVKCLDPVDDDADIYDIAAQGFSFPSAHSACAGALYPTLANGIRKKWLGTVAVILVFLVGVSRFFLGVHYPTDVFAGWALGIAISIVISKLTDKYDDKALYWIIMLLLGAPGLFYCKTTDYFTGYGLYIGCVFAILFEKRFVNFEMPKKKIFYLLRFALGIGVFLAFAQGMKLFLPANLFTRTLRYAIGAFMAMGPYTMLFKIVEKEKK